MRRRLIALVVGALFCVLAPAGAAMAQVQAPQATTDAAQGQQVVLIGVPGLMWSDINQTDTPNLWKLAGSSALGSLSVRTVGNITCPYDGWLTVSAGVRSAVGAKCGMPPTPEKQGEGAVVPEFNWLWDVRDQQYAGTLGQAVHDARQCTMAVGPGAALALADRQGKVDVYADTPAQVTDWTRCKVVAVDAGDLITPYIENDKVTTTVEKLTPEARRAAVKAADATLGPALLHLGTSTVLVAGLSDHGTVPHLRAAMQYTPGPAGSAQPLTLGSRSTHRDDMVILPDFTSTILAGLAVTPPATVVGTTMESHTTGRNVGEQVDSLKVADVAGQTIRDWTGVFFTTVAVLQVAFYITAFLLMRRRSGLRGVRVSAITLASIPASTYLVNLLPWARSPLPTVTLFGAILVTAVLLSAVALLGPWRRSLLGPPTVVAGVTAVVLLADLLTGTPLQLNSMMGYTGVVGARYYGLGNIPFALLATAVLLVTTAIADRLVRSGRRTLAVGLVAGLGGFAMLLDGWPGVGSDFGGVIAFVPGIAVAALIVAGKRVSIIKLGAFCVAGGVLVMGIAYLDYLRPAADQTHLGRFVGQVFDGTFLPVISRKLGAMLHTLISPNLMPVVIAAFAFLVFALLRPGKASAGVLPLAFERAPTLKAGLLGALVSGVVGMLVNDSGAAVLSMALALAVPLVLSAGIRALELGEQAPGTVPSLEPSPAEQPA
ncbi:hypothetical protein [Planotetraspora mira]|uniref:Uncharacterized protein n=1 Tax=Planotetraspora mira TaxID=58121 RepID=A0A8J3TW93_9ACTN|nr:hypothetical protein [Planotetraspora mira]GII34030.1 hypothetical protein Pmi06nite_74720 [Planotetraspora mira]